MFDFDSRFHVAGGSAKSSRLGGKKRGRATRRKADYENWIVPPTSASNAAWG